MSDYGTKMTDRAVRETERRLSQVYREAARDIKSKMKDWEKAHAEREKKYRQQLAEGKITQADFDAWMRGQVFQGNQWKARQNQINEILLNADKAAAQIVNEGKMGVFAANANYVGYELERGVGVRTGFNLYDQNTVSRLIRKDPDMLPKAREGVQKDKSYRWYNKQVASAVTQGIVQGEGVREIAQRIVDKTSEGNYKSAVRHARTAYTGAQNAGRMEGLHQAQGLGINVKKQWVATNDDRTRDTHAELDGQIRDIDEPFEVNGMEIDYPGDPAADPSLVYNCRCTLVYVYPDYPSDMSDGEPTEAQSFEEWEDMKREDEEQEDVSEDVTEPTEEESFTDRLNDMRHDGDYTIDEHKQAGEIVHTEYEDRMKEKYGDKIAEYDQIKAERAELDEWYKDARKQIAEETQGDRTARRERLDELTETDEYKRLTELRSREGALNGELDRLSRQELLDVLHETGDYGGFEKKDILDRLVTNPSYSSGVKDVHDATEYFPTSWTEQRMAAGALNAKRISGRAYYDDYDNSIKTDGSISTSIHEYAHSLEYAIPDLQKAADDFYRYRTAGEKAERLNKIMPGMGYGNDELVKRDNFRDIYMGKDYGSDRDKFATELLSMGYEQLFGSNDRHSRHYYDKDPEMRDWLLGLLTLVN